MNKPLARFLVLAAIGSVPAISHARDLFDAPGPGYRQQMARISPQRVSQIQAEVEGKRKIRRYDDHHEL